MSPYYPSEPALNHDRRRRLLVKRPTRHVPHLLYIPTELRHQIYHCATRSTRYVHLDKDGKPAGHPLAQTCRRLRNEFSVWAKVLLNKVVQIDAEVHDFDFSKIEYLLSSPDSRYTSPLVRRRHTLPSIKGPIRRMPFTPLNPVPLINIHIFITPDFLERPLKFTGLSKMDTWIRRCEQNKDCDRAYSVHFRGERDVELWAKAAASTIWYRYKASADGRYIESMIGQGAYEHWWRMEETREWQEKYGGRLLTH